jgi:hypothetical protein
MIYGKWATLAKGFSSDRLLAWMTKVNITAIEAAVRG